MLFNQQSYGLVDFHLCRKETQSKVSVSGKKYFLNAIAFNFIPGKKVLVPTE